MRDKEKNIEYKLISAFNLLSDEIVESDFGYRKEDFLQYLEVTEWRLAMEELDGVMEDNESPCDEFWNHLIAAAKLMNQEKHVAKYETYKSTT